jgi:hypothetical protein
VSVDGRACCRIPTNALFNAQQYYALLLKFIWFRQTTKHSTKGIDRHSFISDGTLVKQTLMLNTVRADANVEHGEPSLARAQGPALAAGCASFAVHLYAVCLYARTFR